MVVNLDLTEKTIDCFNECAKKGNYEKFVVENQKFVRTLSDNLKKVKFSEKEGISDMVSQNCKFYMDYLTKWNPWDPRGVVPGTTLLERRTPKLVDDLKRALSIRNWDKFYSEYHPTADFIIKTARNQGVLDFQIESGSGLYESFQERDLVFASMQNDTNDRIWEHQNTSLETKNSKEMILKVVPNPKAHQSGKIYSIFQERDDVVRTFKPITTDGIRVSLNTPLETKNSGEINESRSKVNSPTDPVTNNSDDFVLDNSTSSLQWSKDQLISDIDRRIKLQVDDMKQAFQKDWEENVEQFMLEIENSVGHAIETNEAKKTELESKRKQEMDDLKLWVEERMDVRATSIEKRIDKICEELRNEQNEANKRMEDKLNNLIEIFNETMFSTTTKSREPTNETFNQELRNDQISNGTVIENQNVSIANPIPMESLPEVSSSHETDHIDRQINGANQEQLVPERSEVFDQVPDSEHESDGEDFKQEQKDSSKNSKTFEVPDGEEIKTETSGGGVDTDQHGSGSSISVESIPAAVENEQVAQEVNDQDVELNGVNQEEQDTSDESEEEDFEQLLAKQNRANEEEFRKLKERGIQKKQRNEEEIRKISQRIFGNAGGHQSVH